MMNHFVLSNLQVHTDQGVIPRSSVTILDGKIHSLNVPATDIQSFDFPDGFHLIPGSIDLHVHGADGSDVMDASSDALAVICRALAKEGTTGFLATTLTASTQKIEEALSAIQTFSTVQQDGAAILGVHLEGPFLSPKKAGAQLAQELLAPNIELFERWQMLSGDAIKLVTLAPELPGGLDFIDYLSQKKIIASLGHSDATYDEAIAAIAFGCSHATHLFNAMSGIHQREPGAVTAALLSDQVTAELIVDGVHLHPAIVKLALQLKSKNKIVLVTDSMRAKCLKNGMYDLGGQLVTVQDNEARLQDGTLAGSVLKMSSAIKNMMQFTGCSLSDAVIMAAENPAKSLGIFHSKGSIAINKDADLVVLDDKLEVVMTVCAGKIIYLAK